MDKSALYQRLMSTFLDELDEHVRSLNADVLLLEAEPGVDEKREILVRLFRAAHSLKGAARAVELPAIEQVCHQLEDVFRGVQTDALVPTPELCSVMFSAADAIEAAGMQLREKAVLDDGALESLLPQLQQAARGETVVVESPPVEDVAVEPTESVDRSDAVAEAPQPPSAPPLDDAPSQPPGRPARRRSFSSSVRVAEGKLDSLLAQTGELLVARQRVEGRPADVDELSRFVSDWKAEWQSVERLLRSLVRREEGDPLLRRSPRLAARLADVVESTGDNLRQLERRLDRLKRDLTADARQLEHAGASLQDDVHGIRMLPFAQACAGLERVIRDVGRTTGKDVQLVVEGGEIEVDRAVLEGLGDPLLHLVRNAVDHGVETDDERRALSKPTPAKVVVSAALRGSQVDVVVADDGRGLDLERIREKLRQRGMNVPSDEHEVVRSIFLPGFSTAEIVTDLSGRGVGMDVVRSQVESLRGSIDVATMPGLGTRFTLSVPLTLTTVSALFVEAAGRTFAIPVDNVRKLVRLKPDAIRRAQGREVLSLDGRVLPVMSLADALGLPQVEGTEQRTRPAVVLTNGDDAGVFLADAVLNEQEVVVKNLGARISRTRHVAGGILLRSGEVALLLNAANLLRVAAGSTRSAPAAAARVKPAEAVARRLLVVDDSMTTRSLLKSILESAGYNVTAATDGADAWDRLNRDAFDVVVSDVDMPRMSGFELTETIRGSGRFENMPVVLVTARDSEEDKSRGIAAGADAYLVKSAFDQQNILETIEQLV